MAPKGKELSMHHDTHSSGDPSPSQSPSDFLTALWGPGPWERPVFTWTQPEPRSHRLRNPYEADRDWGRRDVYVGVVLPSPGKDLRSNNRIESDEADGTAGLSADVDYEVEGAHKKRNLPSQKEAEDFIAALDPQPTLVVHSGHVYQLWWLFEGGTWALTNDDERLTRNPRSATGPTFRSRRILEDPVVGDAKGG